MSPPFAPPERDPRGKVWRLYRRVLSPIRGAWVGLMQLPQCLLDPNGVFTLKQACFGGLTGQEILGLAIPLGLGALALAMWKLIPRGAKAAKDALTPVNDNWPLFRHLPQRDADQIVPRQKRAALIRQLARGGSTILRASITGMGGIGKTTLALDAAGELANQKQFEGVWWIEAADPDSVRSGLTRLALTLDTSLTEQTANATTGLSLLTGRNQPWLVVYDNATPASVKGLLPAEGPVRLLITSRETNWPEHFGAMELGKMTPGEALEMLRQRLPDAERLSDGDLAAIAARLDFWPLGIEAAAGYLHTHRSVTRARYIELLEAERDRVGDLQWSMSGYDGAQTLAGALALSFDALGQDAKDLLSVFAFLNPDDLWPEMVKEGCADKSTGTSFDGAGLPGRLGPARGKPHQIDVALDELSRHSLVSSSGMGEDTRWTMHRLIGEFWRVTLGADLICWADTAARLADAAIPGDVHNPANWEGYRRLLAQARALLPNATESLAAARLFHQIGAFATARGVTSSDLDFSAASVTINARLQPESGDHALALNTLGALLKEGNPDEALKVFFNVRRIQGRLPEVGPRHPEYAATLNNIAGIYREQRNFARAASRNRVALHIDIMALGEHHPDTAVDWANLGALHSGWAASLPQALRAEHMAKADEYTPRALAAARRAVGEFHPQTATYLNNEAVRLALRGDRPAAVATMRRVVALQLDLRGLNHSWTLKSLETLFRMVRDGDVYKGLRQVAAQIRAEHAVWGQGKVCELCDRHGVSVDSVDAPAKLADAVRAERDHLRAAGAPEQKCAWVAGEFNIAVQALQLSPEPRADFDALLAEGVRRIMAKAAAQ